MNIHNMSSYCPKIVYLSQKFLQNIPRQNILKNNINNINMEEIDKLMQLYYLN